jgi:hypothetical protein
MSVDMLFTTLVGLSGVGALISALVNVLKTLNVVKDGTSQNWVTGANLVAMVVIFILQLAGKADILPVIDSTSGTVSQIIVLVFGLVWQLLSSKTTYNVLKGTAVVGKSYSDDTAKLNS